MDLLQALREWEQNKEKWLFFLWYSIISEIRMVRCLPDSCKDVLKFPVNLAVDVLQHYTNHMWNVRTVALRAGPHHWIKIVLSKSVSAKNISCKNSELWLSNGMHCLSECWTVLTHNSLTSHCFIKVLCQGRTQAKERKHYGPKTDIIASRWVLVQ